MVITECQLYYYVLIINILALFLFNILVFQNTYVIFVVIVQNKMKQNKMKSKNIILLFTLVQSPNQKIPDRKTKCVIKTHINIKQNVIFGAKLKPV